MRLDGASLPSTEAGMIIGNPIVVADLIKVRRAVFFISFSFFYLGKSPALALSPFRWA
jgi:hypothetical protein